MRRPTCSAPRMLTALAVLAVLSAFVTTHHPVRAQDGPGAITATVYGCPAGVTAETAGPETCQIITEGFGLSIFSTEADVPVQYLGTATFDGVSYNWSGFPVPKTYAVAPARPPGSPYTSHLVTVSGAELIHDDLGNALVILTESSPSATISVYNLSPAAEPPQEPAATEPAPVETPTDQPTTDGVAAADDTTDEPSGDPAAIVAGTCATPGDPVAGLTGLTTMDGDPVGSAEAVMVVSAFSRIDLTLGQILAADHALVITADDDPDVVLACGAIGGVAAEDGALSFALRALDGNAASGMTGVAYLAPDGDGAVVTIFLLPASAGSPDGTPGAS